MFIRTSMRVRSHVGLCLIIIFVTVISLLVFNTHMQSHFNHVSVLHSITQTIFNDNEPNCFHFNISRALNVPQDDPCLTRHICKDIFYPNQKDQLTTGRSDAGKHYSQVQQDQTVDELLKGRENGFFIECGAGDGVTLSNTLFLERSRNWTGLLIEADPQTFKELRSQKRSAYLVNNCLSISGHASQMTFQEVVGTTKYLGGLLSGLHPEHAAFLRKTNTTIKQTKVQCYPLYSILLATNRTHVDYLSLDVEGPEIDILKTIPWDKVTIDVITVEYRVIKPPKDPRNKYLEFDWDESFRKLNILKEFMMLKEDYEFVVTLPRADSERKGLDAVYKRKTLNI